MKRVLIIAILMCVLCGCYRDIPTVEFETGTAYEEETVNSIPEVYYYSSEKEKQYKDINFNVAEVSSMDFTLEKFQISVPTGAQLSDYFFDGEKLYYSYDYKMLIYSDAQKIEENLMNSNYKSKLMCYDYREDKTTEIVSFGNNSAMYKLNISGGYLSYIVNDDLYNQDEGLLNEIYPLIMDMSAKEEQDEFVNVLGMTEYEFVSIGNGRYALTCEYTTERKINKLCIIDVESETTEYIVLEKEYDTITYSKGYVILSCVNESSSQIDIYDLNGEYVSGFEINEYVYDVVCNGKLCAWRANDSRGNTYIYVYSFVNDEMVALDAYSGYYLACDGNRVYFSDEANSDINISCYDCETKLLCRELCDIDIYEICYGEQEGIFGEENDMLSSTVETDENGGKVYNFYAIK